MNETIKMQISAFVDGELPENEAELLLRRMGQDEALREQVAEYLEIGRVMRGEAGVPGVDRLRDRVNAELNDRPQEHIVDTATEDTGRRLRPIVGLAIAATVATVAILGLRQTGVQEVDPATLLADEVIEAVEGDGYVVPPGEDVLRQYVMSHGLEASELGAVGMNPRYVSLEFSEELIEDAEEEAVINEEELAKDE